MKRQKRIRLAILIILSVFIINCKGRRLVFEEPQPYKFEYCKKVKKYDIRVDKNDVNLYKFYIKLLRKNIEFCNSQIKDYYKDFENKKKKEK